MTTEQINKISSIEINDIKLLQDPRMGSQTEKCETCRNYHNNCVGHYGHIPLPFPVFQPMLAQQYLVLLEIVCLNCLKLPIIQDRGDFIQQVKKLRSKEEIVCPFCGQILQSFQIEYLERGKLKTKIPLYVKCTKFQAYNIKKILTKENQISKGGEEIVILSPHYVNLVLKNMVGQQETKYIIKNMRSFDCFMIQSIPVPPNSMRVIAQQIQTHAMNTVYSSIIMSKQNLQQQQLFEDDLFLLPLEKYQQILYNRIIIGSRIALFKDTARQQKPQLKQLLLDVLGISTQEPASALSQCLTKKGWFRQHISSARVGMSARTVVVGDPWLDVDQCIIPLYFAQNLFLPRTVDNSNIEKLKSLIMNYPNYPCAVRRIYNKVTYTISEENKQLQALQCNIGDIIMVQLLDGDVLLIQRYPTVREESYTCMRIKVKNTKALALPLSVIDKQGADFDGDEMQCFVLPSLSDCVEAVSCMSACSQFITYQSGVNVIGGNTSTQNICPGMFHLQNEKFINRHFVDITGKNDDEKITGIDLVQKVFENKIYVNEKQKLSQLNYQSNDVVVKNGKFEKIGLDLLASKSLFLTFIQFHHGQYKAIEILNEMTHLSYRVNHVFASTIMNNMLLQKEQIQYLKNITLDRVRMLQNLSNDFYNGKIVAPVGFELRKYFEEIYKQRLEDDVKIQQNKLLECIKIPTTNYLNQYYSKEVVKVVYATSHLGQQFDNGNRISSDKYYKRSIVSYPKFQPTPQSEGYVCGNFYQGLSQKEMYMHAQSERRGAYIRGNVTPIGGYLARRLNQGSGNAFAKPNGIIAIDGEQIISLQYGSCGYGPRNHITIPFDKHKISQEEFDKQYKSHPRYEEMLQIRKDLLEYEQILKQTIPKYQGSNELVIPFKFDQDSISEEELDNILSCRLCEKMSDGFKEIVLSQSYMFYIYALFFLKIDPSSKYSLEEKYLRSLVQIGDPIGMKAALACSQPYTQAMLSAIHVKGGAMTMAQEDQTSGVTRFQELVIGNKGPIIIKFQLLGKAKYDLQKNIKFVSQHQTIRFSDLKPQMQMLLSGDPYLSQKEKIQQAFKKEQNFNDVSKCMIKISFKVKQLAYYIIDLQLMLENIISEHPNQIKMIIPYQEEDNIVLIVYFDINISKQQISMIKTFLLTKQLLGSKLFHHLYFDPPVEVKGQSYTIVGNLTNSQYEVQKNALLNVYSIPGIDPMTIYCSDPKQYMEHCGIVKARLSLYTELNNNLSTDSATKMVWSTHVRLLSDVLTHSGDLSSFTRNSYRKDGLRNVNELILFESGDAFLSQEVQNPHLQIINTSLNSCIFGTRAELGTTVSQILFDNGLRKQDQSKLDQQM